MMKTITMLVATAALITGIAAANAQGTTKQMDEQAGGNSGAVERNPNGTTGGTKANPSPSTTGAAGSQRMPAEKDSSGAPKPTPAPGDVRK
jgi:pectate lyase